MRTLPTALLIVLLAPGYGAGQDTPGSREPAHQLALELGVLVQGLDERMATPLRYTGTAPAVGATYQWLGREWRASVRGAGALPRLTSPITETDGGFQETAWVSGAGHLLRRVWRPRAHLSVWMGPGLALEGAARRHTYASGERQQFDSGFLALHAVAFAELGLGRYGGASEQLALPVAGLAVREEYAGAIGRGPQILLALPPSFLLIQHRLVYRLPAPGRVGAHVFHEASLVRHSDPERLASVSHRIGLAVIWRWGSR